MTTLSARRSRLGGSGTVRHCGTQSRIDVGGLAMGFQLTSTAWTEGQPIPSRYTGAGENLSPPLKWTDPPEASQSLALICEDPDAPGGIFTHWILYNLPVASRELSE